MKYIIASVAVILLAGIGFFILQGTSSEETVCCPPPSSTSRPTALIVTMVEDSVTQKTLAATEEIRISATASTSEGDIIKTSATGRALIESPKSHPTILDYSSELSIRTSEDEGNKTSFELFTGALWSRAKKSAEKGEFYEIKTGNAVAVVRGTAFGISFKNNITTVLVTEGSVAVYNRDPLTGELKLDTETIVTKDKKVIIKEDEAPVLGTISKEDRGLSFFALGDEKPDEKPKEVETPKPDPKPVPTPAPAKAPAATAPVSTPTPKPTTTAASTGGLSPSTIKAGDNNTFIVLTGSGFTNVSSLAINEAVPPGFEVVNDTTIRFNIGRLTPGVYDLYLVLDDGSYAGSYRRIPEQLTVTD